MSEPTKDAQTPQPAQNSQVESVKTEAQSAASPVAVSNSAKPDKTVKVPKFASCMASDPVADQEIVHALRPKASEE